MTAFDLRVATLNISGGEKTFEEFPQEAQLSRKEALELLVSDLDAAVLCLQEASQYIDADGVTHSLMSEINRIGNYNHFFYGETVSMETHMHVRKDIMVKGLFNDWWNWSKGNAIHSRIPFARLGNPNRTGVPRSIPLYQPSTYEGNRDTDPRSALLTRLKQPPFPFVVTLHLTTLIGERKPQIQPNKIEQSHLMRYQQVCRLLDMVREHILARGEPLILTGDFNATEDEFCIAHLLETQNGFIRLKPENDGPSHPGLDKAIDHIFFYPQERLVDYTCRIETSEISRQASDHLPVVADLQIK
jgi:endonuclease/exonuclease/phosphatase family metal-dependent hydrolase